MVNRFLCSVSKSRLTIMRRWNGPYFESEIFPGQVQLHQVQLSKLPPVSNREFFLTRNPVQFVCKRQRAHGSVRDEGLETDRVFSLSNSRYHDEHVARQFCRPFR